jgi:uncharacterized protein involved in response to NO
MDTFSNRIEKWEPLLAEPYRLFFPLGALFAVAGMGVWIPSYLWPQALPFPGPGHAALQIQGFMYCFILGFLCTMLPKVLGIPRLGFAQFGLFVLGLAGFAVTALLPNPVPGQALHLLLLLNLLAFVLRGGSRAWGRAPASFVFIAVALFADLAGSVLRVLALAGAIGPEALKAAGPLEYQAFPLLLILGVGGFLMPKLFGGGIPDPRALMPGTAATAASLLPYGLVFTASCELELPGNQPLFSRIGYGIRAGIWAWFLFRRLALHRVPGGLPPYLAGARISLYSIGAGLLLPVLFPAYVLAWEHLIFVSGLLWVTLAIATRVVTAHGGRLDLLGRHRWKTLGYGGLLLLAAATRVSTGIWSRGYALHLALASGFALTGIAIWAWIHLPLVRHFPRGANAPAR